MFLEKDGKKVFANGKTDYEEAKKDAENCPYYSDDYEEEWVTADKRSCYNCRYRRWTAESFTCMKNL